MTTHVVSQDELNLSTKLNCLLGDLSAEISLLATARTIQSWTPTEILHSVCRCKDALIDALRCAVRLSQLGNLDEISEQWISEILRLSEGDQALLDHVEEDFVKECGTSRS